MSKANGGVVSSESTWLVIEHPGARFCLRLRPIGLALRATPRVSGGELLASDPG